MQAYCLKCKAHREMSEAVATFTRTGQATTKGVCSVCGTTMYKMGETIDHANLEKPEKASPATKPKAKKGKAPRLRNPARLPQRNRVGSLLASS